MIHLKRVKVLAARVCTPCPNRKWDAVGHGIFS